MSSCRCKWPVIIDKSPLHQTIIRIIDSSALARTIKSLIRRSWYNSPGSSLYVDCLLMLHTLNTKHLHTVNAPTPAQGEEFFFPSRKATVEWGEWCVRASLCGDEEGGWEDTATCGSAHCLLIVNLPAEVMPGRSTTGSQWMPPTMRTKKPLLTCEPAHSNFLSLNTSEKKSALFVSRLKWRSPWKGPQSDMDHSWQLGYLLEVQYLPAFNCSNTSTNCGLDH